MKLRHRHIPAADALKADTRERIVEWDEQDRPVRTANESYAPAHAHAIEQADGRRIVVHHRNGPALAALLAGRDDDPPGDSDAVYIKFDPRKPRDNVTYQRPVRAAALARVKAAVARGDLPVVQES